MSFLRNYFVRLALGLAVVAVFALHTVGIIDLALVRRLEDLTYDMRLRLAATGEVDPRIVIVDIDEHSLRREGHWPWDRLKLKRLIDRLFDVYGARVVGIDIVFAERDENHILRELRARLTRHGNTAAQTLLVELKPLLQRDALFASAFKKRPVVLGYYFNHDPDVPTVGVLPPPLFAPEMRLNERIYAPRAASFGANLAVLQKHAVGGGFFNNPLIDGDGVTRRVALLEEYKGALYESFALAVARVYVGAPLLPVLSDMPAENNYPALEALQLGGKRIPLDAEGGVLVPYRGPQGSYTYVSAADVLHGRVENREGLRDRIVLVGTTAPGMLDLRATPLQNVYAGVEIHANVISGILDERLKKRPAYLLGAELLGLILIGVALAAMLPLFGAGWSLIVVVSLLTVIVGGNLYLWQRADLVLPVAAPAALVLGLFFLDAGYGYLVESRGKRRLGGLFGQYVPPELVVQMSRRPKRYTLKGEKRNMTVLFTDLRDFTTLSERLDPEELSQLMNEFLTPMTSIIHEHYGTIDKYMGDAIMAFWGAPVPDPDHAPRTVAAALRMIEEVRVLAGRFEARGWPALRMGVGINTGQMNVGNMGSRFRMAYTVLGDAVNTGARLQSLSKIYGVDIITSGATKLAAPEFVYRELGLVRVKGRDRPITVYEPLGTADTVDKAVMTELPLYRTALAQFHAREWDRAEEIFSRLAASSPRPGLYQSYLARLGGYRANAPAAGWDGVYVQR